MMRRLPNRKDANQAQIVHALVDLGAVVVDVTGDTSIGFDILVGWHGILIPVEIKDGSKLTKGEMRRREQLARAGVKVHIVTSVEDAANLINSVEARNE